MSTLWIKDPLAILAEGAERGVVVRGAEIVERVGKGREPGTPVEATFDAGEHVVLPGLINTHHHFYQTLTRACPPALDKTLFPWLEALYPVWARLTPDALRAAAQLAFAELLLSGCTTTTDHHYVFPAGLEQAIDIEVGGGAPARHPRRPHPRLDEPVGRGRRAAARGRGAERGHASSPTANG